MFKKMKDKMDMSPENYLRRNQMSLLTQKKTQL